MISLRGKISEELTCKKLGMRDKYGEVFCTHPSIQQFRYTGLLGILQKLKVLLFQDHLVQRFG